jgi:predicted permease
MPLIAFAIARFGFGMGGHELFAVVTLAALPAAQNVFNYASRYETAVGVARDAVLLSSLVAIPAMVVISALLA